MQKKVSLTNPKDVPNAEKNADSSTEKTEKCMMRSVQNAELKLRFRSGRLRVKKFIAKIVFQNLIRNEGLYPSFLHIYAAV